MKALDRIRPTQGIAAMQSINAAVPGSLFGMTFLGTAAACAALAVFSLFRWHKPGAGYLLAGRLIYLAGAILVAMIFNVPKNNLLAAVDPASGEGARLWIDYVSSWTATFFPIPPICFSSLSIENLFPSIWVSVNQACKIILSVISIAC